MKITLAENISEITLEQFQNYDALLKEMPKDFENRKLQIFTGMQPRLIKSLTQKDKVEILELIDQSLNKTVDFKNTFEFNGVKYGFIPNLDNITGFEFADLQSAGMEVKDLHIVMAILFRPIVKEDSFGNYLIEPYEGTEKTELLMKKIPLNLVNGALVFFSNLAKELLTDILKFTQEELRKVKVLQDTLKNGDGTRRFLN
jgi:hypothetical protein